MMPDHIDTYTAYSRQRERDEDHQYEINQLEEKMNDLKLEVKIAIDPAIDLTRNYDSEDNANLCNRLENIGAMLIVLYDKMEG